MKTDCTAPINSRLNVVVRYPTPFGLSRNGWWPSRGSVAPGTPLIQTIFLPSCPVNDRKRAVHSLLEIGRLFSLFYLSLARLLILLLLIGGNANPNPGPVFSCLVCAENVTQRRRSVQCCTRSKWIHFRCSLLSFSRFNTLGSSHAWSCPPGFIWRFHTYQHCDFLFGFLQLVYLHC